jgi:uncharacterized protein
MNHASTRYKESRYNTWFDRGELRYVYNGVSGGLLALPVAQWAALKQVLDDPAGELDTCTPPVGELLAGRMLIEESVDELAVLGQRYAQGREDSRHLGLTVVTSLGCNFACPYCFEAKSPSVMDAEVQAAVVQLLDDRLPHLQSFSVAWFGGEPLIGKRALLALSDVFIERCRRHGVQYDASIVTNGSLLDRETCEQLRARGVSRVQLSLDGPPDVHDRMRPTVGGHGTFWKILENLEIAVEHFKVSLRINANKENFASVEQLLRILADRGLAGRMSAYIGQLVAVDDAVDNPSGQVRAACFSSHEYAAAQLEFFALAQAYGFGHARLPRPVGAPCTAVKRHELVIGSAGELYKCYVNVGNPHEVIGDIRRYREAGGRLHKWLQYDPFANAECRSCIALPGCMGGCAHHAMDERIADNRCGTFRHTYREQVQRFVELAEGHRSDDTPRVAVCRAPTSVGSTRRTIALIPAA